MLLVAAGSNAGGNQVALGAICFHVIFQPGTKQAAQLGIVGTDRARKVGVIGFQKFGVRNIVAADGIHHIVIGADLAHLAGHGFKVDDSIGTGISAVFNKCFRRCIILEHLGEDELDGVSGSDVVFQVSAAHGGFIVGLSFRNADGVLLGGGHCRAGRRCRSRRTGSCAAAAGR